MLCLQFVKRVLQAFNYHLAGTLSQRFSAVLCAVPTSKTVKLISSDISITTSDWGHQTKKKRERERETKRRCTYSCILLKFIMIGHCSFHCKRSRGQHCFDIACARVCVHFFPFVQWIVWKTVGAAIATLFGFADLYSPSLRLTEHIKDLAVTWLPNASFATHSLLQNVLSAICCTTYVAQKERVDHLLRPYCTHLCNSGATYCHVQHYKDLYTIIIPHMCIKCAQAACNFSATCRELILCAVQEWALSHSSGASAREVEATVNFHFTALPIVLCVHSMLHPMHFHWAAVLCHSVTDPKVAGSNLTCGAYILT